MRARLVPSLSPSPSGNRTRKCIRRRRDRGRSRSRSRGRRRKLSLILSPSPSLDPSLSRSRRGRRRRRRDAWILSTRQSDPESLRLSSGSGLIGDGNEKRKRVENENERRSANVNETHRLPQLHNNQHPWCARTRRRRGAVADRACSSRSAIERSMGTSWTSRRMRASGHHRIARAGEYVLGCGVPCPLSPLPSPRFHALDGWLATSWRSYTHVGPHDDLPRPSSAHNSRCDAQSPIIKDDLVLSLSA